MDQRPNAEDITTFGLLGGALMLVGIPAYEIATFAAWQGALEVPRVLQLIGPVGLILGIILGLLSVVIGQFFWLEFNDAPEWTLACLIRYLLFWTYLLAGIALACVSFYKLWIMTIPT